MADIKTHLRNLVHILLNHSCMVNANDKVMIEAIDIPEEVIMYLLDTLNQKKAIPLLNLKSQALMNRIAKNATPETFDLIAEMEINQMKQAQCFIGLRAVNNIYEMADVPADKKKIVLNHYIKPVHYAYRNNHLKWVYFRYPTPAMAQNASMSTQSFETYYFYTVIIDYRMLKEQMQPLAKLMENTNNVRIEAPNTDLSFSIKGMGCFGSAGEHNIPDGEVYSAPIKDSINGKILFNVDSVYYGTHFQNIQLEFNAGRIFKAISKKNLERLIEILNMDEGARYIGEFAIGLNPFIDKPINDILFDEKMYGSIHLAIGNAYPNADNGNRSSIHWDLILNQRQEYGGGKLYFDDVLVKKNGLFVLPELEHLNAEKLKSIVSLKG